MVRNWDRWLSGLLAAALGGNGLVMLFSSQAWYDAVPGVPATGPFNAHFVRDIGAAYLVAGLGAAWFAWRPREGWAALAAGALFLTFHAGIHVYDAACGATPWADVAQDFTGVYLLAALPLLLALFRRPADA
ncbi:hypothetical protein [Phenylobacterium sp.]|uniref:hypothetical protein n=1 Tax=Phenylobacterium sp. TaxID=1871053 RepID=UPI0039593D7F